MKKLVMSAIFLAAIFMISACAADNENEDENTSEHTENHSQDVESQPAMSQTDLVDKMSELDYVVYDFDVIYEETEFEGEIEDDDGIIEAEFYNPFEDVQSRGSEAFEAMFPILLELELNPDMSDEEAISTSLEAFNLPEDFLKATLEVVFTDGTEVDYVVKR
ncbi:YusW family protein [Ornithinibacillus caprae]|nr:YusW family protein [Ornithinibacillus caprae]